MATPSRGWPISLRGWQEIGCGHRVPVSVVALSQAGIEMYRDAGPTERDLYRLHDPPEIRREDRVNAGPSPLPTLAASDLPRSDSRPSFQPVAVPASLSVLTESSPRRFLLARCPSQCAVHISPLDAERPIPSRWSLRWRPLRKSLDPCIDRLRGYVSREYGWQQLCQTTGATMSGHASSSSTVSHRAPIE